MTFGNFLLTTLAVILGVVLAAQAITFISTVTCTLIGKAC